MRRSVSLLPVKLARPREGVTGAAVAVAIEAAVVARPAALVADNSSSLLVPVEG